MGSRCRSATRPPRPPRSSDRSPRGSTSLRAAGRFDRVPSRELAVGDRVLTVHDAGAADGPVILHHHGTPLAGGPLAAWEQDAAARGARLVCYDRPGYGASTR